MDLFEIIPQNFFSPLASKNRNLYFNLIMVAFRVYEEGSILGINKKIVVDEMVNYLDAKHYDFELDQPDEILEEETKNNRGLCNYVLRRLEDTGWIDIDVTNDYEEILNFRDYAITILEALQDINYTSYGDDSSSINGTEYRGYIYTIYSLLMNKTNIDYGILMDQIYRNTKLFIRQLRKLDSRLKDYIRSVVETTDIKELMDKLITYKVDLADDGYYKLKTSDNINKYRLTIVNELEEFETDPDIMSLIIASYKGKFHDEAKATDRAYRDLNEVIDIFNSLDEMVTEIDLKNKNYINSTIGKIKFLLSEDDNIIGKLNLVLKHIKNAYKKNRLDRAIKDINPIFVMGETNQLHQNSLYEPRGYYKKNGNHALFEEGFEIDVDNLDFLKEYETPYTDAYLESYININMVDDKADAKKLLGSEGTIDAILRVLYALIYASEHNYKVIKLGGYVDTGKVKMTNFEIIRSE